MTIADRAAVYRKAKPSLAEFLLVQAEGCLDVQMDLLKAQTTRASAMVAVSATLSGGGLAIAAGRAAASDYGPVLWAAMPFTLFCILAALPSAAILWPQVIYPPSFAPQQFDDEIAQQRELDEVRPEAIALLEHRIGENFRVLARAGVLARIGLLTLALAPILGASGALYASHETLWAMAVFICAAALPLGWLLSLVVAWVSRKAKAARCKAAGQVPSANGPRDDVT